MFRVNSIPDKSKVSKAGWEAYLDEVAKHTPTNQQKINYDLMLFGVDIFHVSSDGEIKQVEVLSKEGQEALNKLDNDR